MAEHLAVRLPASLIAKREGAAAILRLNAAIAREHAAPSGRLRTGNVEDCKTGNARSHNDHPADQ